MMKQFILSLLLIFMFIVGHSQSIQVSKPLIELNENVFSIKYDILNSNPNEKYIIHLDIEDSNGKSINAQALSGDIGNMVNGGSGKEISWDLELDMSGNVLEYCSDWYAEDAYAQTGTEVTDPTGPESGSEHVVRGGFYASDAAELRSAARFSTDTEAWLKTDCQQPKSIWWFSDMKGIGFRVVCETENIAE